MKYEVLKRSHLKRNILIAILIIVLLLGIVIIKNKTNTLSNGSINKESITKELNDNLIGAYIQEGEEYIQTDDIPISGYEFNSEESYCKIGDTIQEDITLFYDMDTQTLTVSPITKEGMKCYLYFDEKASGSETILAQEGGAEAIEAKGTPDFSKTATTDEGMYATEDDYGTSYYYRGAVNDNWFQFGTNSSREPLYWRIVRINGNGSIRLIYNGPTKSSTDESTMITSQKFNSSSNNNFSNNNMYVGYMYKDGEVHGLVESSDIKKELDEWYFANLTGEADKLDGNAGFCGDRTSTTTDGGAPNDTGGTGTTTTYYGARYRLSTNKTPSFKCAYEDASGVKQDLYTTNGSSKGNGKLTYPIGLITADEVAFAGGVVGSTNTSYYLYNNASYWTMSPYWYGGGAAYVFRLNSGFLSNWAVNGTAPGVRPVINIRSDVEITGSGTTTDPFAVVS